MAKRFTSTLKWQDPWYRKLTLVEKCFWAYLLDSCDHAGIWTVDFELASFCINYDLDEKALRRSFTDRFFEVASGKKWVIRNFIPFQYTQLTAGNRAHDSVLRILQDEGLTYPYDAPNKGLNKGKDECKDKDKDKDKIKDSKPLTKKEAEELIKKEAARQNGSGDE